MRILDEVHNGDPALQADYLKDGHPRKAYIVERNGALERVLVTGPTLGIVSIPVDALAHRFVDVSLAGQ